MNSVKTYVYNDLRTLDIHLIDDRFNYKTNSQVHNQVFITVFNKAANELKYNVIFKISGDLNESIWS